MVFNKFKSLFLIVFLGGLVVFTFGLWFSQQHGFNRPKIGESDSVRIGDYLKKHDPQYTFEQFANGSIVSQPNHFKAHIFGETLFKEFDTEGLGYCGAGFGFGCFHGFMMAAIADKGLVVVDRLNKVCQERFGMRETGCRHGIGHGLQAHLATEGLMQALQYCQKLQPVNILGCAQGVFMEYNRPIIVNGNQINSTVRVLDTTDPYAPCSGIDDIYKRACYFEIIEWWDTVFNKDYQKIAELCTNLAKPKEKEACFLGMGRSAGELSGYDSGFTTGICSAIINNEDRVNCFAGAYWIFSRRDNVTTDPTIFCDNNWVSNQVCLEQYSKIR